MQVKAGSETVLGSLTNAGEVELYLRAIPCLHSMLLVQGPVVFKLRACDAELRAGLPPGMQSALETMRANRSQAKLGLYPSECSGFPVYH